jgi:hypothetical protein
MEYKTTLCQRSLQKQKYVLDVAQMKIISLITVNTRILFATTQVCPPRKDKTTGNISQQCTCDQGTSKFKQNKINLVSCRSLPQHHTEKVSCRTHV